MVARGPDSNESDRAQSRYRGCDAVFPTARFTEVAETAFLAPGGTKLVPVILNFETHSKIPAGVICLGSSVSIASQVFLSFLRATSRDATVAGRKSGFALVRAS